MPPQPTAAILTFVMCVPLSRVPMRIGFNTWSLATVPYATFIPRLADIGYTALAISVVPGYTIGGQYVANACDLAGLDASDRRRIRALLTERELVLASVVGNQSLVHDDPEHNERALARLRGAIDLCVELAQDTVPTMNTGVAGRTGDLEAKRDLIVDRLGGLTDYARQRGVVVCIEPHVGGAVDTVQRAQRIVQWIDSAHCRLDFDVSHFEVQAVPLADSMDLLALTAAAEIKDQRCRPAAEGDAWLIVGNGVGEATAPDGRPLQFQFLLGGEGDFDLVGYLTAMQAAGFTRPIAFEASVQCQARPDYDGLAAATTTYHWMLAGWQRAGISPS